MRPRSQRVVIVGAAGRDFHNFNVVYRNDPAVEVVAFTAAQIPGIDDRRYPAALAGPRYPEGIPIFAEADLERVIGEQRADTVVFAYSDVTHQDVMHVASRALSTGADVVLLGPERTMLSSRRPVIAISAARTGTGKSQTARYVNRLLRDRGVRTAVIRHPMPYGDLEAQRVQRFATMADLNIAECTAEEREEYEPHIAAGSVVFAGVDYAAILDAAEREADVIVWDGGNNDFPFLRPTLHVALIDALRPGHADAYHPGEAVVRMADVVVITKTNAATPEQIAATEDEARRLNPRATLIRAASPVTLDTPDAVRGKRVLAVDDGPTLTHGGMPYGAGYVAAREAGASEIIDPRPFATPAIAEAFARYPHLGAVLPALGYDDEQLAELRATIEAAPSDVVVVAGTPIDLAGLLGLERPVVRARYEYADAGEPTLGAIIDARIGTGA
ncbi:MAG: cyclic 2,3-diphosphoglycerate synthase [Chloroflexi bacterium]|nr:cyclic 2,3-diphosphoglycerate synthase [Chloroflexota bacterium]